MVAFAHGYPFDPTHGFDLDRLLALEPPAPPADFAAFWAARRAAAIALDPEPRLDHATVVGDLEIWDVTYHSTDGVVIGGWYVRPADDFVERAMVITHGYGGRDGPDLDRVPPRAAVLFPCLRGLSRSARPDIPSDPSGHVLHGIDDPATYVLGGCVDDVWLAVSVLLVLAPQTRTHIAYSGISFGGGIGALALPWEERIARAELLLPTFGHQALRLTLPMTGSGAAVAAHATRHGDVMRTLIYYDAAIAAAFVDRPVLCGCALFDPAVPPPRSVRCPQRSRRSAPPRHFRRWSFRLSCEDRPGPPPPDSLASLLRQPMKREHHRWFSPRLGRDMDLLIFGHAGANLLVFPTRDGRFWEYEQLGMIDRLAGKIEAGHMQVWCLEGLDGETFYGPGHPWHRIRRYAAYEAYVLEEVLPLMSRINPHPATIAHGLSLGAHHAADIAFRHPHLFAKLAAFSGRYDLTASVEHFGDLLHGHYEDEVYFHMPSHYLPGLGDDWRLRELQRMDIVLVCGEDDPFLDNNRHLSQVLASKGVGHRLEVWHGRAHSGGAWRRMAQIYI